MMFRHRLDEHGMLSDTSQHPLACAGRLLRECLDVWTTRATHTAHDSLSYPGVFRGGTSVPLAPQC